MRLKIVLIMWIGMALFSCNVVGTNYRAIYDFEYTKDSINSIKGEDILYLEISKNSSFCFSYLKIVLFVLVIIPIIPIP